MKVCILAGGLGTRLSEETITKPKPMVEIGGKPILWHIMKIYSSYGFNEFVIALGYKGEIIKDYFLNYHYHAHSLSINNKTNEINVHDGENDPWLIHLLDTGNNTNTGGRVKQLAQFVGNETFMLTYGDGVGNINIPALVETHQNAKRFVTVTGVHPPSRFGEIICDQEKVTSFAEKPQSDQAWINGGFFVLEPQIINYIKNNDTLWESDPMENLVKEEQVTIYKHEDFWQCMDSIRDVRTLENLWTENKAPWKIW
jgi:glucose-1-phosphate cytidylyltransferase